MTKERIVETNEGIQNEITAEMYNVFSKNMNEKGWNNVSTIISKGITKGDLLEIGSGPGYVGLELKSRVPISSLTGLEISPAMIKIAQKNALEYHENVNYVLGSGEKIHFPNCSFDGVFSNGSLHEWEHPIDTFNEIFRVLKNGGRFCITDLRRDVSKIKYMLIRSTTKPKEMRSGLKSSLKAAYTKNEIEKLLNDSSLSDAEVINDFFGLTVFGMKS